MLTIPNYVLYSPRLKSLIRLETMENALQVLWQSYKRKYKSVSYVWHCACSPCRGGQNSS